MNNVGSARCVEQNDQEKLLASPLPARIVASDGRPHMRTPYVPSTIRHILCIFPCYAPSFGTFHHAYALLGGVRAFMPPQGLLLIAAYLPESWQVRFVDENARSATADDFRWADAVLVSGMHVQRSSIDDIVRRAHECGRPVALGGPSASGIPIATPRSNVTGQWDFEFGDLGASIGRNLTYLSEVAATNTLYGTTGSGDFVDIPHINDTPATVMYVRGQLTRPAGGHMPFVPRLARRVQRHRLVPERAEHLHPASVVPHGGRHHAAGVGHAGHLAHRGRPIRDEIDDE